jgi:hypothetical protein
MKYTYISITFVAFFFLLHLSDAFILSPNSCTVAKQNLKPGLCKISSASNRCNLLKLSLSISNEKKIKLPPPQEVIDDALAKAEEVIKNAGGCIDSISFGAAWKQKFPEFSRDRFQGTTVSSFNKLFKVIDMFDVWTDLSLRSMFLIVRCRNRNSVKETSS